MSEPSLKEKTAKGLFWGGFSNAIWQLLNLLFGIILARLLSASDYGMVGMLTIFSAIASALQEGGFISALTNRKEICHKDYNAVFWFSTLCSISLYILLFFASPLIADFYNIPELTPLSRLLFLSFVISSMNIAPRAYLFKSLRIKESTIISLSGVVISGVVGITLAANGFAYWGIAYQGLSFVTVITILSFYFSGWRPKLQFDFKPIKEMIGFSSKMIITNIFTIINNNIFTVLLGKLYSQREVGNFTQAYKWMGNALISGMINSIAQPVFTSVSDDKVRQLTIFRKLLRLTAFISFPAMFGLSLIAPEFIIISITEKWLETIPILQLLCVWGAFIPIVSLFSNLLISRGHSSIYMWCTISLSLLQLAAIYLTHPFGLDWMLRVFVTIHIGWVFVWLRFVHGEIGLTLVNMLKDITPYLLLTILSVTIAHYATHPIDNLYLSLVAKVAITTGIYLVSLWKLHSVIFHESIEFLLKKRKT